jgi:hypothetical protein
MGHGEKGDAGDLARRLIARPGTVTLASIPD